MTTQNQAFVAVPTRVLYEGRVGGAASGQLRVQFCHRSGAGAAAGGWRNPRSRGCLRVSRARLGRREGRRPAGRNSSRLLRAIPARHLLSSAGSSRVPSASGRPGGPSRRSLRAPLTATFRLRGPGGGGGPAAPPANRRSERRGEPRPSSLADQSEPRLRTGGRDFRGRGGGFVCASAARSRLPAGGGAWGARPGPTPRAALGGGGGGGVPSPAVVGGPRRGGGVPPRAR